MNVKNRLAVVLATALLGLSATACSASSSASTAAASPQMAPAAGAETNQIVMSSAADARLEEESAVTDAAAAPVTSSRKMIRRVWLQVESKDYDGLTAWLASQVTELGGYIEESEQSGRADDPGGRSAYYVARIPSDQVDRFASAVGEKSNIVSKRESAEDVTLQYVDVESRKKALKIEQERLLALLEKAGKLEDIITLEQRLSEVRYELEQYESTLRTFDNQIEYSTVTINLNEVDRITPAAEKTVGDRMRVGFNKSLYDIGRGVQELAIVAVAGLPYLIILAVVVLAVFAVVRFIVYGGRKRKQAGSGDPPAGRK